MRVRANPRQIVKGRFGSVDRGRARISRADDPKPVYLARGKFAAGADPFEALPG
jgi:hypothetical protein